MIAGGVAAGLVTAITWAISRVPRRALHMDLPAGEPLTVEALRGLVSSGTPAAGDPRWLRELVEAYFAARDDRERLAAINEAVAQRESELRALEAWPRAGLGVALAGGTMSMVFGFVTGGLRATYAAVPLALVAAGIALGARRALPAALSAHRALVNRVVDALGAGLGEVGLELPRRRTQERRERRSGRRRRALSANGDDG